MLIASFLWMYIFFHDLQVTVHIKGRTECYECQPKPTRKTYPVCTITSTPSKVESQIFLMVIAIVTVRLFPYSFLGNHVHRVVVQQFTSA